MATMVSGKLSRRSVLATNAQHAKLREKALNDIHHAIVGMGIRRTKKESRVCNKWQGIVNNAFSYLTISKLNLDPEPGYVWIAFEELDLDVIGAPFQSLHKKERFRALEFDNLLATRKKLNRHSGG